MIAVSGGTLAPAVGAMQMSLIGTGMLGTGISGGVSGITATAQDKFVMLDWLQDFSISAGTSIITLGAGYGAGAIAGAALTSSTALSETTITALATATGGFAGAQM